MARLDLTRGSEVRWFIHDKWFAVEGISSNGGDLVVPFASREVRHATEASIDSTMRIHHVRSWSIANDERLGFDLFDTVAFDEATGLLRVFGGMSVVVEAFVDQVAVTLEMPEGSLEVAPRRRLKFFQNRLKLFQNP